MNFTDSIFADGEARLKTKRKPSPTPATLAEALDAVVGNLCRDTETGKYVSCDGVPEGSYTKPAPPAIAPEELAAASRKIVESPVTTAYEREHAADFAEAALLAAKSIANGDSRDHHALRRPDGTYEYLPPRAARHARIIDKMLAGGVPKEQPTLVLMGGLPGAGKSTAVAANLRKEGKVVVNADDVKAELPEYAGWNAAYLHEESSEIVEAALVAARMMRYDVVFDATLKSSAGALQRMATFQRDGYRVEARFVDVDVATSIQRAGDHYLEAKKKGDVARFVPFDYIRSAALVDGSTKPRATFEALRDQMDAYVIVDNRGSRPLPIAQRGKLIESAALRAALEG